MFCVILLSIFPVLLLNEFVMFLICSVSNGFWYNYAYASFVLSGAFAIGACLTISNLEICISLAVAALVFIAIGCYCSYKASTVLSDVTSTQFDNAIGLG